MSDEKVAIPATAKALYYEAYGDFKQVLKVGNLPVPEPKAGQILVKTVAAALNPVDWKISAGYLAKVFPVAFPNTYGFDGAGVVVKLGPGVDSFKVGDEVYFSNSGLGSFAEYSLAAVTQASRKPKSLSWEETAGVPVVFLTAYQALKFHSVKAGTKVLILGGSSSVGLAAVQIAKNWGAWVAATCSTNKIDLVKGFGADVTVDYKTKKYHEEFKAGEFDVVFDTISEEGSYQKALPLIKKGGLFVATLNRGAQSTADVEYIGMNCDANKGSVQLPELNALFDAGKLKVVVDKVYKFELNDLLDMITYSVSGRATGKLVVRIAP